MAPVAFAEVNTDCPNDGPTFTHELGHLFGGIHGESRPRADQRFPYAYSHVDSTQPPPFPATIMTAHDHGRWQVGYFSTIRVTPNRWILGVEDERDMERALKSTLVDAATFSDYIRPARPDTLTGSSVLVGGGGRTTLTWKDRSSRETAFLVDYRRLWEPSWVRGATLAAGVETATITGIGAGSSFLAGTVYEYRVGASNAYGVTYSEFITLRMPGTRTVSLTGFADASAVENAAWTSATPAVSGARSPAFWSVSGADAARFVLNEKNGRVTLSARNYEHPEDSDRDNVYEVTVTLTDADGFKASKAIEVTVTDVNEPPVFAYGPKQTISVPENTTGRLPWIPGVYDQDGGKLTFSLSGADAASFRIDSTPYLWPASGTVLDYETKSSYSVTVEATDSGSLTSRQALTILVTDVNETAAVTLKVSPNPVAEGSSATVTAELSKPWGTALTIPLTATDGTAKSATDYAAPASVQVAAGKSSGTASFSATADADVGEETMTLALDESKLPAGVVAGAVKSVTVTIADRTPVANLKVSPNPVTEGDGATVTVELSRTWGGSLTFALATAPSGASPAESGDYAAPGGVTVPAGKKSAAGSLGTVDDSDRDDEGLSISLPAVLPAGVAAGADSTVAVTIEDTTPQPVTKPTVSLGVSPNPVREGSSLTVTATLSAALGSSVTIPLTVTRGTAETGDFDNPSAISISANSLSGSTSLATKVDEDRDAETLTVALGALPGDVRRGSPSSVAVTITDATTRPSVSLGVSPNPVREGSFAVIEARLSRSLGRALRVPLLVSGGTAEAGDYVAPDAVTIAGGQLSGRIGMRLIDDVDADDETVVVSLGALPSEVTPGSPGRETATTSP